jgi:hypothetical protein
LDVDLTRVIDLHIHTAPDVVPRSVTDLQAAQQALNAGMRAILIKSHVTCTADRAQIAQQAVGGLSVLGGLVLNETVGGLNPAAVEAALSLGAAMIWLPTFGGRPRHSEVTLDHHGQLKSVVREIMALVRDAGKVLATGHVGFEESLAVVRAAQEMNLLRVLITHPEWPGVDLSTEELRSLAADFVVFEHCHLNGRDPNGLSRITAQIRAVGAENTILTTDLGQSANPTPVEGMRQFIADLLSQGFSQREVDLMARENPARLMTL